MMLLIDTCMDVHCSMLLFLEKGPWHSRDISTDLDKMSMTLVRTLNLLYLSIGRDPHERVHEREMKVSPFCP